MRESFLAVHGFLEHYSTALFNFESQKKIPGVPVPLLCLEVARLGDTIVADGSIALARVKSMLVSCCMRLCCEKTTQLLFTFCVVDFCRLNWTIRWIIANTAMNLAAS